MIVKLNGIDVSSECDGARNSVVTASRKNKRGTQSKSYSNELTFTGTAYDLIYAELVTNPDGKNNTVKLELFDDCCLDDDGNPFLAFEGVIMGDMISWCYNDCKIKVTSIEETDDTKKLDCLQSTLVANDSLGFKSQVHPRVTYCNELRPEWLHDVVIILGIIVNLILVVLSLVVAVISVIIQAICAIVNLVGGNCPPGLQNGILDDYNDMINNLNEVITGCGRQHPSPFVRSYIKNVCDICGITFSSSILNNPASDYYDSMYLSAPVEKGTRDNSVLFIDKNEPIKSGEMFLQEMGTLFNADYRIENGILEFERVDYFWTGNVWINYQDLIDQNLVEEHLCFKWRNEDRPAYARFEYLPDPVELCGNEAKDRYSDIVEWNNPVSNAQKGASENYMPFGMSRFRNDGIDRDVLSSYSNAPFLAGIINDYDTALLMEKGVAFQPKILIWDGGDINDARTKRFNVSGFSIPSSENYNFPYFFNEHNCAQNQYYATNTSDMALYGRFHAIKNPKCSPDQGREFSFSFKFNCDHLRTFNVWKNITLPTGTGRIESAEIDYSQRIIKVIGHI